MTLSAPSSTEILFSRNRREIVVSGISDSSRFEVTISSGERSYDFVAKPFGGTYRMQLADIMTALEGNEYMPAVPPGGMLVKYPETVHIEFRETPELSLSPTVKSCDISWFPGFCPENLISQMRGAAFWLTVKNQSSMTYSWSKEVLAVMASAGSSVGSINIKAALHLEKAGKVVVPYLSIPSESASRIVFIDCSYHSIENMAVSNGYSDDRILAYDIYGLSGTKQMPLGQRFIVAPDNRDIRAWHYRNSLGGFDTVYSSGTLQRAIDSEAKTFRAEGKEIELTNESSETYNVDTGYIRNTGDLNSWYELLRSSERYVIQRDGSAVRIVIDSSDSKKTVGDLGSISFKCRFAEDANGYAFEKVELEELSDEFT